MCKLQFDDDELFILRTALSVAQSHYLQVSRRNVGKVMRNEALMLVRRIEALQRKIGEE